MLVIAHTILFFFTSSIYIPFSLRSLLHLSIFLSMLVPISTSTFLYFHNYCINVSASPPISVSIAVCISVCVHVSVLVFVYLALSLSPCSPLQVPWRPPSAPRSHRWRARRCGWSFPSDQPLATECCISS